MTEQQKKTAGVAIASLVFLSSTSPKMMPENPCNHWVGV